MKMSKDFRLLPFNTFGIDVKSKYACVIKNEDKLRNAIHSEVFLNNPRIILGGGSNVLFTKDFEGLVLINEIKGINVKHETEDEVIVQVGAGENWHGFVLYAIEKGWGGIENLSLIPGSVGASPMQNIGAYGVEIKDVFFELEAMDIRTGEIKYFDKDACDFGYRESVFKKSAKDQFFITRVTYKLTKRNHKLNTSYGAIEAELEQAGVQPSIKSISDAVVSIRKSKLPDPKEIGNAGSFFKNPVIEEAQFQKLQKSFPDMVNYPSDSGVKIAAGWLIDQLGWKGKTFENYGVHKNQALVLVNYGGAEGEQIWDLSQQIIDAVKEKYDIQLEREVNIY
jgi:UDP-N-acetylmuramate dehydrogenase